MTISDPGEAAFGVIGDHLGPAKVVVLRSPADHLLGYLVIDNTAAGPAIGGVRMHPDLTVTEVARLARAMTLKNAMARLPHGGAKGGIVADPTQPVSAKEHLVRAYARAIAQLAEYIPGPDMGTDERAMGWIHDEIGRAVGLPAVLGGIPLDEVGATGFGVAVCAEVVAEWLGGSLQGARVVIQGFGAVGRHAARFLADRGARVVAVADSRGAVFAPEGIDVGALTRHKGTSGQVAGLGGTGAITAEELLSVDCELWIPAAGPDVIVAGNAMSVRARAVLPGANIAVSDEADDLLHQRGVLCMPDFVVNAGGVICGAVEYRGGTRADAFNRIAETVRDNTTQVLRAAQRDGVTPRQAATAIAQGRVQEAESYRRAGSAGDIALELVEPGPGTGVARRPPVPAG